jgi:hypothetical protein
MPSVNALRHIPVGARHDIPRATGNMDDVARGNPGDTLGRHNGLRGSLPHSTIATAEAAEYSEDAGRHQPSALDKARFWKDVCNKNPR